MCCRTQTNISQPVVEEEAVAEVHNEHKYSAKAAEAVSSSGGRPDFFDNHNTFICILVFKASMYQTQYKSGGTVHNM